MPNEIGMELENQNPPAEDRSQGGFSKFLHDPKNIATALIFGASLLQPRQPGTNALQTIASRAVGAAAFRGALESGVQQQKLKREQTAFERAQIAKENAQRERQISVSEEGVGLQRQQMQQQDEQFDERMGFEGEQARLDRELQLKLAGIRNAPTEADLITIAMQSVPYLLETIQFEEGLTPAQRIQIAQNEAIKGVLQTRAILESGGKFVLGPDGRTYVDDGKGGNMTPWVTPTPQAPTPAPTAAAPTQRPAQERVAAMDEQQRNSVFAPTIGQRAARANAGAAAMREQATTSSQQAARHNAIRAAALRTKRLMELGSSQFRQEDINILQGVGDAELAAFGLTPQMIVGIRRLSNMR